MTKVQSIPSGSGAGAQSRSRRTGATARPGRAGCVFALERSLRGAKRVDEPFTHWLLADALPTAVITALCDLPLPPPPPAAEDGTREARNEFRTYIDPAAIGRSPTCRAVAKAFQDGEVIRAIEAVTGAALKATFLRLELTQDIDGFWLKPHTDLGVKRFTLLCYLDAAGQRDVGTDLYAGPADWRARVPFEPGRALAFVPSPSSWHGFEPRPIRDIRRSLIVNYVTPEWRAREQLAFPRTPIVRPAALH